ncbi:MAG: hypothetical protein V2A79_07745 [Planctomycetota bacterium]
MNLDASLEVDFYGEDAVAVQLKAPATEDQTLSELLLFALFAIRQMVNLKGNEVSPALATHLAVAAKDIKGITGHRSSQGPDLVPYRGPGLKRFISSVHATDDRFRFDMKPRGFGIACRGIGYYAPNAVVATLRHLARQHATDDVFLRRLSFVAGACGEVFLSGQASLTNQGPIAMTIALAAVAKDAELQSEASSDANHGAPPIFDTEDGGGDDDSSDSNEDDEDVSDDDDSDERKAPNDGPRDSLEHKATMTRGVNWFWPHSKIGTGGFCVLLTMALVAGIVKNDLIGGIVNVGVWYVIVIIIRAVVLSSMREGQKK